jgi:DNA uptake protein ComE-like DNA-binding protein
MDDAAVHIAYSLAEREPIMKSRLPYNRRPAGSVLIVVLVVCLGLVSMTLVLGHSMLLAYRGSDNELAGRQADMAIEGAAQYAEAILSNVSQPGEMPDPNNYQAQAVPLGEATFWFIGEPDATETSNLPVFKLVDEASKLNLNTATLAMLENLPGMTQDLAQAIVTWRSSSSASPTPGAASSSSEVKNAPFESVEELAQVNGGTDLVTLYGSDTNLNHVLDPDESAGGATAFNPGLLEYVTVFSRQPNTLSSGQKRVNVTQGPSGALSNLLNSALGATRGAQITATMRRAGPVRSVLEFYNKSGMTAAEFALVSGTLSMSNSTYSKGLINVNTASETVLECVPGITESTAQQIVSTREAQTQPITNLSWVAPILGKAASAQAGPYLTAETYQISADIAAVGRHGRGYRRTLFVIDNSSGTPQILYRRNLSGLGWALGSEERQALAKQEASP